MPDFYDFCQRVSARTRTSVRPVTRFASRSANAPWMIGEIDHPRRDPVELRRSEIRADALPDLEPRGAWCRDRVDPEQRNPAQDEWHDRGLELGAAGEPDARDVPPEVDGAREPGEELAADVVDRAGPLCLFERARPGIDLRAIEHARRAELTEIGLGIGLAAHGHDLVAAPGQHVDRDAPDAAAGSGHDDRAAVRSLRVLLHPVDGERGGETSGAERHRLAFAHARRQFDEPITSDTGVLGVSAVVRFREPATGNKHLLARCVAGVRRAHDLAREIDAADQRIAPQDRRGAGRSKRVLVVDARPADPHDDFTWRKIVEPDVVEPRLDAAVITMNAQGLERLHPGILQVAPCQARASQTSSPCVLRRTSGSSS